MLESLPREKQLQVWSEDPLFVLYPTPLSVLLPPSPPSKTLLWFYAISLMIIIARECDENLFHCEDPYALVVIYYSILFVLLVLFGIFGPIIKSDKSLFFVSFFSTKFLLKTKLTILFNN